MWRPQKAELILWYYESHRPSNDCPIRRVLVAVMIVIYFLHENELKFAEENDNANNLFGEYENMKILQNKKKKIFGFWFLVFWFLI